MSIVVDQVLPFPKAQLDLENSKRWANLFPLMRPTVFKSSSSKEQSILIDKALPNSGSVHIAAIGSTGNFSSKILQERGIVAFATNTSGRNDVVARDIETALLSNGIEVKNGLVVIKVSGERGIDIVSPAVLEVRVNGELEFDHLLSLLLTVNSDSRNSIENITPLLELFLETTANARSSFAQLKRGSNPTIDHANEEAAIFESAKQAIQKDLAHVLESHIVEEKAVVYSVHYSDINGLSRLENWILAHEISGWLDAQNLAYSISSSTVLDHSIETRGWATSICPVPTRYLQAQTKPANNVAKISSPTPGVAIQRRNPEPKILFDDATVRRCIILGCESVIKAEPTITEYDTIVGDGDCGYTLRDGAKQVLHFIADKDLTNLPVKLSALVDDLEVNMGGTSGALYCIFLSSLSQNLWTASSLADALCLSLQHLLNYTRARLGDRTMLDCLIPFVETFKSSGDIRMALGAASQGVETTKKLEAKLGRSTYLDESATRGIPDPGAYGLLVLLEGMGKV